ncbi:MAG: hypothetical protein CML17_03075, partial [Pusillimonas sp.]|nr:hypothetical protein [Pusillimonas sp.]
MLSTLSPFLRKLNGKQNAYRPAWFLKKRHDPLPRQLCCTRNGTHATHASPTPAPVEPAHASWRVLLIITCGDARYLAGLIMNTIRLQRRLLAP